MTSTELLQTLRSLGAHLSIQEDRLRVDAPRGAIDAALQIFLHERKNELIQLLRAESLPPVRSSADQAPTSTPLSFAQERIWLFQELEPDSATYNLTPVARITGPLNREEFDRAIRRVVERHAPLRTRIVELGTELVQQADAAPVSILRFEDLTTLPMVERSTVARTLIKREKAHAFDLRLEHPFRALLIRHGPELHDLVLTFHHIAADGTSIGLFFRDLLALYAGKSLPELPASYADVALWEREQWSAERLAEEIAFWKEHLEGAPRLLELPTDHPRPAVPSYTGALISRTLPESTRSALLRLARQEKGSLFMALLAAFGAALYRMSGQRDLIIGTPTSGRYRSEVQELIGMFVNQLPLRIRMERGASFRALLQSARREALTGFAHQEVPFVRLVEHLDPPRDRSRTPLFQAVLNLLPPVEENLALQAGDTRFQIPETEELLSLFDGQAKFDLTLYAAERGGSLQLLLVYNRDLFDAERMETLLAEVEQALRAAVVEPDRRLEERWAAAATPLPIWTSDAAEPDITGEGSVVERFERLARLHPERPALVGPEGESRYGYLLADIERIARLVAGTRAGTDAPVGVLVPHGPDAVAAILGVLRSGRAYLPLDPSYPEPRLAYMAEDSALEVILTTPALAERARQVLCPTGRVLLLDEAPAPEAMLPPHPAPEAIAYRLYTSGSTGRPKAVVQSHRNLLHQAERYARALELGPGDRLAWMASISFDASLMDIFGALTAAAALCPIDARATDLALLSMLVEEHELTILHLTPTVFRTLSRIAPEARYPSVRALVLGGEPVRTSDIRAFDEGFPEDAQLLNLYGASEHSFALGWRAPRTHRSLEVPIGFPVGDVEVVLLDEAGSVDPVRGEIALRSEQGALGYWRNPERTARCYLPDPVHPGRMLYRTGDLARRRPDGALVFLHRSDQQLKIRGHRIEPAEVEAVLAAHPAVEEAAAYGATDAGGESVLAAAVRFSEGERVTFRELAQWCAAELPIYLVPTAWTALERLPRTPSGKIDRRALPTPDANAAGELAFLAPRTAEEQMIAELWAEVLGRSQEGIGVEEDFFALGGHSLSATQVVARVRDLFEVELPLRHFFDHPTIAETAAWLREQDGARAPLPSITRREQDAAPLSFSQERLWLFQELEPEASTYHITPVLRITGALEVDRLAEALRGLVERQAALRTVLEDDGTGVRQRVCPTSEALLRVEDLTEPDESRRGDVLREVVRREQGRPFDLRREIPFRALLVRHEAELHDLVLTFHHIAADGTSIGLFLRDLLALYAERPLPELPIRYTDFAAWEREQWSGARLEEEIGLWKQHLEGAPRVLELPTDRARAAQPSYTGALLSRELPESTRSALLVLARQEKGSLFMALLAAFGAALYRMSGQRDLIIGTPTSGRNRSEVQELIGMFVNQLPLRMRLERGASFRDLVQAARRSALWGFAHQEVPFARLVEALDPPRDRSRTPLFQAMLNLLPPEREDVLGEVAGVCISPPPRDEIRSLLDQQSKFDLTLYAAERRGALHLGLVYNRDLFDAERMSALLEEVEEILQAGIAEPDRPVEERWAARADRSPWAWMEPEGEQDTLIERVLDVAAERAEAVALVDDDGDVSWSALRGDAERLARLLAATGGAGEPVGIFVEHRSAAASALLGALWAGRPYLPLDPAYPESRLRFMVEDSGASTILCDSALAARAAAIFAGVRVIALDAAAPAGAPLPPPPAPESTAYLLYTSGSTGTPKAVMQTHRNLVRQAERYGRVLGLGPTDRVTLTASISFDASLMDLFGGLLRGATVVFLDLRERELGLLPALLAERSCTTFHTTPSVFRSLARLARGARFPGIRAVVLGGEAVSPAEVAYFDEHFSEGAQLLNLYGASEHSFSLGCLLERARHRESTEIPLGWPVGEVEPVLLSEDGTPDPVRGELALRGDASARGYWKRPELTARAFIPDPERPGRTLYRTGDVVRRRHDGALVFLHRADQQMKIRGHRVEPGEIESALAGHPAVAEAAVHAPVGPDGEATLAACVALRAADGASIAELQAWCREHLPAFAVPSAWVLVDALPRTPSGKVDRRALPAVSDGFALERVKPRTAEELMLAELWAEVLGRSQDEIGVEEDFFALGGHSLSATQVVARVRDLFEVELPLRHFFDHPTIAETAAWLRSLDGARAPLPPITRHEEDAAPLSFSQERMWFLQELSPESSAYHMGAASLLEGELDLDRLRGAVEAVVRRQEALRTRVVTERGRPFQRVDPEPAHEFEVVDFSSAPPEGRLERARERAREMIRRPYDLATGPLFRILVVRLGEQEHLFAVGVHHIVADLWSLGILAREIALLYERPDAALAELPARYRDFSAWQRAWLTGDQLGGQLHYWTERLRGLPVLELPTDHPRPRFYEFNGGIIRAELAPRIGAQIQRLSAAAHATPFMVLLAAFNALLHAHSRQTDLAVGVPIANRTQTATEGLIGTFVNTLVHRNDLSGDPSVRELIGRVRSTALDAYVHQDVPFELLVKELAPERDTSRSPLFQVLFNVGNAPVTAPPISAVRSAPVPLDRGAAQFDLTMNVNANVVSLGYNASLYSRETAERFLAHYLEILERAVADPEMRLSELAAVATPERECLLERWNRTEQAYPREVNAAALLAASAERTPHRVAVDSPTGSYTYAELQEAAQRITAALVEMGVEPGDHVGILMERSREMLAALLGILGAGAAYVPVDPAYPEARVAYMLENSRAAALVTHRSLERRYALAVPTLDLDRAELPPPLPFRATRPEQAAYVIYTSGSTGKPKGVEVPHGAMVNFLHAMAAEPGLGVDDVMLALTTISFDIAVLELFLPLVVGARVVILSEPEMADGRRIAERLEQHGVTVMQATPATFKLLLAAGWAGKADLKVLCGGEPLPSALADDLLERVAELWNMYGPTETTVWSTVERIRAGEPILVGRPIANTSVYVLDEAQRLLPIGTPGELYIGGDGVANGYMNRPDLTRERFIPSPFRPGERLYRTGDQVRFRPDGRLEHLGRLDHQVKVRGFRIELGEVEAVLRAHPAVQDAVVVAREDRLVAYPVFRGEEPPLAELRRWMAEGLPPYMMPSVFVPLSALPLTPNGKVDRKQLPEPQDAPREAAEVQPPRHPNELLVAEVWAMLLEMDQVGVDDNFFELGGHSLLAMQAVALIEERTGYRMDPRSLFFQSLGELARTIPEAVVVPA